MIDRQPSGRAVQDGVSVDAASLVLPWSDPAVQWGLGVFETAAVRAGVTHFLSEHIVRLVATAVRFEVPLPPPSTIEEASGVVAAGVRSGHGWLKILASRSGRWTVFGGESDPSEEGSPASVVVLPWRRHRLDPLTGSKSLAYAPSIVGLEEARRRGADEGLWLNERGHVIEACAANVFVVRGRAAVTPALGDGARDGVTRSRAIAALRDLGLSVRLSKVRIVTLRNADEIFLTSSLGGIRPVLRVDKGVIGGGSPGSTTVRLAERLREALPSRAVSHGEPGR